MRTYLPIAEISAARAVPTWAAGPTRSTQDQDDVAERARRSGVRLEETGNTLVLNYTMRCPLACDFCCYSCGPHRTETMHRGLALDLVDQAAALGVFAQVAITGGEPFTCYDDLVVLAERMSRNGLPFSVITAGAWATDGGEVDRLLEPLVRLGLRRLAVSHDPSHERWVGRDQVRRVVDGALARGLEVAVYGTFYDASATLRDLFPDYAASGAVPLFDRVARPAVGRRRRAARLPSQHPDADWTAHDTCYTRVYHEVTVFWDGETYPCCSVYNRETPGLSFGNVYDEPLWRIWDRIERSEFLRLVKRRGYAEMFATLRRRAPDVWAALPAEPDAMDACHLCHLVMGDVAVARSIRDALDPVSPSGPDAPEMAGSHDRPGQPPRTTSGGGR